MKKYKTIKLIAVLTVIFVFAGILSSCTSGSKSDKIKIGVIQYAPHPSLDNCYTGLVEGLKQAGYVDGDTISIDFKNAQGSMETSDQIAKNMVGKKYDLIIGIATPSAMSAFKATEDSGIPTVFCAVSDPVSAQLVEKLDKPNTHATGTSDLLNLEAQLKLIRALQPSAKKIGILYTTSEANSLSHLAEIKTLAPKYNFEIVEQGVQNASDIPQATTSLVSKVDCINNFTDNNVVNNLNVVLQKANDAKIPVYGSELEQVKNGCIASESLDYIALGKETGALAASVLKGAKPADTAVVLVKDSKPIINTDVLAKFGITLPSEYANAQTVKTAE